jgi:hypothetical protein
VAPRRCLAQLGLALECYFFEDSLVHHLTDPSRS